MGRNANQPGATSEGRFTAQANGAGHSRPAADDKDMAEVTFVRISFPWSLHGPHGIVADPLHNGLLRCTALGRDVETGKTQITDAGRSLLQKQATLKTDKSHSQVCLYGNTHHAASIGIQPGWQIERQDRRDMSVDSVNDFGKSAFKLTIPARAQPRRP